MRLDAGQAGRSQHHRAFQDPDVAAGLRAGGFSGFRRMFEPQGVPRETAEAYIALLSEPGAIEGAIAWYRGAPFASGGGVGPVGTPTLYVWGDEDATVSRFHCEVRIGEDGARVRDLDSRNGTVVDGVRVADGFLRGGSLIKLGRVGPRFEFSSALMTRISG